MSDLFPHSKTQIGLQMSTYKSAGVDIEAGDETVRRIKSMVRTTFNSNTLTDIGMFGGFYALDKNACKEPVLVSSVDGVGTKLKVAIMADRHNTIGEDIVNHCVNDIAVCGAEPLFFLDYLAFGKLVPEKAEQIISGIVKACRENQCALIGGETAEMPGMYEENDYDISGTIVGIVDKESIINGRSISKGDVLIGFSSTGLHTNGYSLARKVLLSAFKLGDKPGPLQETIADALLKVHKSYLPLIKELKKRLQVKGLSHITGGGIVGNTMRVIPDGLALSIDWNVWQLPPLFRLIQETGGISDDEMRNVFNLGIGLIAIVDKKDAEAVMSLTEWEPVLMGEVF